MTRQLVGQETDQNHMDVPKILSADWLRPENEMINRFYLMHISIPITMILPVLSIDWHIGKIVNWRHDKQVHIFPILFHPVTHYALNLAFISFTDARHILTRHYRPFSSAKYDAKVRLYDFWPRTLLPRSYGYENYCDPKAKFCLNCFRDLTWCIDKNIFNSVCILVRKIVFWIPFYALAIPAAIEGQKTIKLIRS